MAAMALGLHPLFGILAGSVTLTGGPATGLAFAPLFEQAGVSGAATIAVAVAMGGIISGGLVGGPVGTFLIERQALRKARSRPLELEVPTAANIVENQLPELPSAAPANEDKESYVLLKNLVAIMMAMWIGSWVTSWFAAAEITLPAYIGA